MGLGIEDLRAVHSVSLLRFLGCTADSSETAQMAGGDDLTLNAEMAPVMNGSRVEGIRQLVKAARRGEPRSRKAGWCLPLSPSGEPAGGLAAHCEVATMLARRLGIEERVTTALLAPMYGGMATGTPPDGRRGYPGIRTGVANAAGDVDSSSGWEPMWPAWWSAEAARHTTRWWSERSRALAGADTDPHGRGVGVRAPAPLRYVEDLDAALAAMADFADLKSPWMRGHSTKVAELAETAANRPGWEARGPESQTLGWFTTWGGGVCPTASGTSPVRSPPTSGNGASPLLSHPSDPARCTGLAELEGLASSHHERLDGSGYHRQATASQLSIEARLLAAADAAAVTSTRPHREAPEVAAAERTLRGD